MACTATHLFCRCFSALFSKYASLIPILHPFNREKLITPLVQSFLKLRFAVLSRSLVNSSNAFFGVRCKWFSFFFRSSSGSASMAFCLLIKRVYQKHKFCYLSRQKHRVVHPVIIMDAIAKTLNAFFHQALKIITIIIAEKYFQPTLAAMRYMVNAVQEVSLLFSCRWVNITLLMQVRSLTLLHLSSLFGSHWLAPVILSRPCPCRSASGTASSQRVHLASADAARAMIRLLSDSARSRGVFLC